MNFLAHIYLSNDDQEIAFGNFLGDFVKGQYKDRFPKKIAFGIDLHRKIDNYTDHHEIFKRSKSLLRPIYGHYQPVIIDIFYDHILAKNWHNYHQRDLKEFTSNFYETCHRYRDLLPDKSIPLVDYMVKEDWLYNYSRLEGIQRTFEGMSKRSSFKSNMEKATEDLNENINQLEKDFDQFMTEIKPFILSYFNQYSNNS